MILNHEYPAPKPTLRNLVISIFFGVFISFFLIFFEPFEINISNGKNPIGSLMFFGAISAFILVVFLYLLPLCMPRLFNDKYWKVVHQMIFCTVILLVIATLNGLCTNYINSLSFSWANYWWIIKRTVVLGSIPFTFLILVDYQRRNTIYKGTASLITDSKSNYRRQEESKTFSIATDLKNETFIFDSGQFIYAIAEGNYTDLYFFDGIESTCQTYRVSLSSFEEQLDTTYLLRCHRSYLVNLDKVINVSGNAQGLKLTLIDNNTVIPVSRKYIPAIKKFFSKTDS